jgi:hypothetical protein
MTYERYLAALFAEFGAYIGSIVGGGVIDDKNPNIDSFLLEDTFYALA